MIISREFEEAVRESNLTRVRVMLKDSLVVDPSFREFDKLEEYARKKLNNLYENHDEDEFEFEKDKWDKNYMNQELNNLMYNFSNERIKHLKNVCKYIYSDRIDNIGKVKSNNNEENIRIIGTKKISTVATVGGVGLVVAGLVLDKVALVVGGVAITVVGGISLINNNKE